MGILINATTGAVLATAVHRASGLIERAFGLIPRTALTANEGLWFEECSSIHTLGMHVPIDVFFLDKQGHLLKIVRHVMPHIPSISYPPALQVVETGITTEMGLDVLIGDRFLLEEDRRKSGDLNEAMLAHKA